MGGTYRRSRGVHRVTAPARRAGRRAEHRRDPPLLASPDHPRRRDGRAEAAEERQGPGRRRGWSRLSRPALPGRGRRRNARHHRLRHRRRVQSPAPGHPRRLRRRPAQGRVRRGQHPGDQPAGERGRPQHRAGPRQRQGDLRRLRPDRRRHRQLRDPLHGQRRRGAARQAVRLGFDLPLRRPGVRVLGGARPLLPLPLPGAAAARHGPVLRRGRRSRRALRVDRLDPGQRGDQADHGHRRAAGRQADGLRRPGDGVPQGQGPQGPGVRALRREPDGHRPARGLRGLLRRGLRGGAGGHPERDDHRARAQGLDGHGQGRVPCRRPRARRVRDRQHPGRDADPQGRHPVRRCAVPLPAGPADRAALQVRRALGGGPRGAEGGGLQGRRARAGRHRVVGQHVDPSLPSY